MYQPKLALYFNPPIQNDDNGVEILHSILQTIGMIYPEAHWWYGGKPVEYNPFIHREDEDDSFAELICSLTVGFRDRWPDRLTYGQFCDDDEWSDVYQDGWEWYEENRLDTDQTSQMFDDLNESTRKFYTKEDLKTLYDDKTLFYEVDDEEGKPVTTTYGVGDGVGDIFYIDRYEEDGKYAICYKIKVEGYPEGIQECLSSPESKIIKWLNDGVLKPVHSFMDVDMDTIFESEGLRLPTPKIGDKLIYTGKNFENLKDYFTVGKTYSVANVLDISIYVLDNISRPWEFTTYKLDGLSWEDFFEPLPEVDMDYAFEPLNESKEEHPEFKVGEYVVVNGYYRGTIYKTNDTNIIFDDDLAKVLDVQHNYIGFWYLLEFKDKELPTTPTGGGTIFLINGRDSGGDWAINVNIERPNELDLDTVFD